MTPYGRRNRTHTHVAGHQDCGICHPEGVSKARARREGKRIPKAFQGLAGRDAGELPEWMLGLTGEG